MNNDNDEWKILLKNALLLVVLGFLISMVLVNMFKVKFISIIDPNATACNDILGLTIIIGIPLAVIYILIKMFPLFFYPKS